MNKLTLLGVVLGGVVLWGSYSYEHAAPAPPLDSRFMPIVRHAAAPAGLSFDLLAATPAPDPGADKPAYSLQLVEGISLYDDQAAVIQSLGAPQAIKHDPYTKEFEIYQYPGLDVGFSLGVVDYVKVWPQAGSIDIDNVTIPMTLEAVTEELGKPDFVAEDGLVFKRQQAVIKLFIDAQTQSLTSIDYFHRTNS